MAFGKPAITTPSKLDARPVQDAVRSIRQRIEAIEAALAIAQTTLVTVQQVVASGSTGGGGGGGGGGGSGSVTSVSATVPSFLSVSGVPITTSGTISITLATQTANTVFAGPNGGGAAAPTFRALEWDYDIPLITSVSFSSGVDGSEAVLIERYGVFHWVTVQDIANLAGAGPTLAPSHLLGRGSSSGSGQGESISLGTGLSLAGTVLSATTSGTAPISPDTEPLVVDPANDEFTFGTSIDTAGARFVGATPWAWVNQGGATATVAQGNVVLTAPASGSRDMRIVVQAVSGSAWTYRAKMTGVQGNLTNFFVVGMLVRNSGTGFMLAFEKLFTGNLAMEFDRLTSPTTFSAAIAGPTPTLFGNNRAFAQSMYFEFQLAAGVLAVRFSDTGVDGSFIEFGTEPVATFILSIDEIGLFTDSLNSFDAFGVWDWFRRTA